MITQQRVYTYYEFEQRIASEPNSDRFELIYGTIVEKPMPTQERGMIIARFSFYMVAYLDENPIGNFSVETAHKVEGDQYNKRIPDASYMSKASGMTTQGAVPQTPDIAIEVLSPDQSPLELREKAQYYLNNQTQIVWIVFPNTQQIEVRTDDTVTVLGADDTLTAEAVLPGFKVEVGKLFKRV